MDEQRDPLLESMQRAAPIIKVLSIIEEFRPWTVLSDQDGNYTITRGSLPPELQRIYDLGMETLKGMRVVYNPLLANAAVGALEKTLWQIREET